MLRNISLCLKKPFCAAQIRCPTQRSRALAKIEANNLLDMSTIDIGLVEPGECACVPSRAAFRKHTAELCNKFYCLAGRLKLFNAVVAPVVLYICCMWALKKTMENKVHATWRCMLRYVFRTHRLQHVSPDSGPETMGRLRPEDGPFGGRSGCQGRRR